MINIKTLKIEVVETPGDNGIINIQLNKEFKNMSAFEALGLLDIVRTQIHNQLINPISINPVNNLTESKSDKL